MLCHGWDSYPRNHLRRACGIKQSEPERVCSHRSSSGRPRCAGVMRGGWSWALPGLRLPSTHHQQAERGVWHQLHCHGLRFPRTNLLHSQSAWALGDCKASTETCSKNSQKSRLRMQRARDASGHISHGVAGEVRGMLARRGGNSA